MKNGEDYENILEKPKKTFQRFVLRVMFSGVVATMLSFQNYDHAPAATPVPTAISQCKIQALSISGAATESAMATYTYDFVFNYTYDQNGNQTGQTATYKRKSSDGKMSTTSNSTSNQFDGNNYIIRQVVQSGSPGKDGTVSTTNVEYTYVNERLIKEDHNAVDNGKSRNYSVSYEYNIEGKLTKLSSTSNNSYTKYEWNGKKLQKITNVDRNGNITSPLLEYDNDGRLIKSIKTSEGSSDEFRYQYNAEGQIVRYEQYLNTKRSTAFTSEYDNKENPLPLMYPALKGHPSVPRVRAEPKYKNNAVKEVTYAGDPATEEWKVIGTSLYTYDYNNKNLPTEVVGQTLDSNGILTNITRASYVYQDCQ